VTHRRSIAVIGLGYVGLPVAVSFARAGVPVVGFDVDRTRVSELQAGHDRTREVEADDLRHGSLAFSHELADIGNSDFFIVTVPTPIDDAHKMAHHRVRRMPIVDERGRLIGILAQGDLARHARQNAGADESRAVGEVVGEVSEPVRNVQR